MTRLLLLVLCLFAAPGQAETLGVAGGTFEIEWRSSFSAAEKTRLRHWLSNAAESTALINGTFPLPITSILIQKSNRGKGPVPWGNTIRHTMPEGISFHVNPKLSLNDFITDWTATHEFSHLFLPYLGLEDRWVSEGFASYYQYILMMRKGTLSQQVGWQKLADGFARGAADPNQQIQLNVASKEMRQRRAFKRVYWSGAHYFLEADLRLRDKGTSLDEVISKFLLCCKNREITWNGLKLADALDEAADTRLFAPLFADYQETTQLPDYRTSLAALGITFNGNGVVLGGSEAQRQLRDEISSTR